MSSDVPTSAKGRRLLIPERESKLLPGIFFTAALVSPLMRRQDIEPTFVSFRHCPSTVHPIVALVTFQHVQDALIEYTPEAQEGKDTCRERFFAFMATVVQKLQEGRPQMDEAQGLEEGQGATTAPQIVIDWPDPMTGHPMKGESGSTPYSEVDGIEQLLALDMNHVCGMGGGCRVVTHPRFGTSVYPATAFVYGPTAFIKETLETL
jgi:hypothetical protein